MKNLASVIFNSLMAILAILTVQPAAFSSGSTQPLVKLRPVSELLRPPQPAKITATLMEKLTPENAHIVVSLSQQRAYLMSGGEVVIDTPISSGKSTAATPTGKFKITSKESVHQSSAYGDFVDKNGRILESGVSSQIDSAPSETHFKPMPMKWFCGFGSGLAFYAGDLPGYPATQGGIRLPDDIAQIFFKKVKVGTPVEIAQ